jgi:hypothetical protein
MSIEKQGSYSGSPEIGETISDSSKATGRIIYPDRAFELARELEAERVLEDMMNGKSAQVSISYLPGSTGRLSLVDCVRVLDEQGSDALADLIRLYSKTVELKKLIRHAVSSALFARLAARINST